MKPLPKDREKFWKYLRSKDLRFTPQRELILREVFSTHDHFQADDLFARLYIKDKRISRATVYRTLSLLAEGGFLREVISGERHGHYEHVLGHLHHDHLVCADCGRVIEFRNRKIEDLQRQVCKDHEFEPKTHRLEIEGLCKECRRKNQSAR